MGFELRADVTSWGRTVRRPQRIAGPAFRDEIGALIECRSTRGKLPGGGLAALLR